MIGSAGIAVIASVEGQGPGAARANSTGRSHRRAGVGGLSPRNGCRACAHQRSDRRLARDRHGVARRGRNVLSADIGEDLGREPTRGIAGRQVQVGVQVRRIDLMCDAGDLRAQLDAVRGRRNLYEVRLAPVVGCVGISGTESQLVVGNGIAVEIAELDELHTAVVGLHVQIDMHVGRGLSRQRHVIRVGIGLAGLDRRRHALLRHDQVAVGRCDHHTRRIIVIDLRHQRGHDQIVIGAAVCGIGPLNHGVLDVDQLQPFGEQVLRRRNCHHLGNEPVGAVEQQGGAELAAVEGDALAAALGIGFLQRAGRGRDAHVLIRRPRQHDRVLGARQRIGVRGIAFE